MLKIMGKKIFTILRSKNCLLLFQNMQGRDVDSQNAEEIVQYVKRNSPKRVGVS